MRSESDLSVIASVGEFINFLKSMRAFCIYNNNIHNRNNGRGNDENGNDIAMILTKMHCSWVHIFCAQIFMQIGYVI